jgi:hypothetical protein
MVHWTIYAALIVSGLSMVGTFVYVWFTYRIMKIAVGQGKAAVEVSRLTVKEARLQRARVDDKLKTLLGEINIMCAMATLVGSEYTVLPDEHGGEPTIRSHISRLQELRDMNIEEDLRPPLGLLHSKLNIILGFRIAMKAGSGDREAIRAATTDFANETAALATALLSSHFHIDQGIPPVPNLQQDT